MIATTLAPVLGGLLAQAFGWRGPFWFLAIFSGVFFLTLFLFVPETLRKVVGNGSIPARGVNRLGVDLLRRRRSPAASQHEKEMIQERKPNPCAGPQHGHQPLPDRVGAPRDSAVGVWRYQEEKRERA